MDDELRIHPVRPYPADNNSRRQREDRPDEQDEKPAERPPADPDPEVQEGHIDTRVAPPVRGDELPKVGDPRWR